MSKRFTIILLIVIGGFVGLVLATSGQKDTEPQREVGYLKPVSSFQHAHGLSLDTADSKKLYIATHNGLFMLQDEKELYQVGPATDDFMGFSAHPTDPKTFYTSGHPTAGGNIGFQKTTDAGKTWQKVSSGANGPVDFHAMAVSRAAPEIVYGSYAGNLQRSRDSGKNWQVLNTSVNGVISLVSHPSDADTVYATTAKGIQRSVDQGETWSDAAPSLIGGAVTVLALNPSLPTEWLSFSEKLGLAKSVDSGQTWQQLRLGATDEVVLHVAYDVKNAAIVYALTQANTLYKTVDGGETWLKIR